MSLRTRLRHRVWPTLGVLALGVVSTLVVPSAATAEDVPGDCTSSVSHWATAESVLALQEVGRARDAQRATEYLAGAGLPDGSWSDTPGGASAVGATARVVTALHRGQAAGSETGRRWLTGLQEPTGQLVLGQQDPRWAVVHALPALTGEPARLAADWLTGRLVDGGGDGNPDHFPTDGGYDYHLTAEAVIAWSDTGLGDPTRTAATAAWLGRHVGDYLENLPGTGSLARLILVAEASQQSPTAFGPNGIDLVAALVAQQDERGLFAEELGMHALAVQALGVLQPSLSATDQDALDRGVDALVAQSCSNGATPTWARVVTEPEVTPSPSVPTDTPSSAPSTTISLIPAVSRTLEPSELVGPVDPSDPTSAPTEISGTVDPSASGDPETTDDATGEVDPGSGLADGIHLDLDEIVAGSPVTFTVAGFAPSERVRVELHSTPVVLGYFQVDQRGVGTTTVTVPAATSPGRHHIWVIGEDSGLQFAKTVTIVPAQEQPTVEVLGTTRQQVAAAAAGGRLSSTGVGAGTMSAAWIGTLVLLGGIGLVAATRSRRHQPRH